LKQLKNFTRRDGALGSEKKRKVSYSFIKIFLEIKCHMLNFHPPDSFFIQFTKKGKVLQHKQQVEVEIGIRPSTFCPFKEPTISVYFCPGNYGKE